jgi:diguanylate cyclase
MRDKIDKNTVYNVSRKVLMLMSQMDIPLYPENYLLWFDYVTGINKELQKDINDILKTGKPFTDEISGELYNKHFQKEERLKLVQDAQREIQKILKEVLDEILNTQHLTSGYRDKLQEFANQLNAVKDLNEIHQIVADMMVTTIKMVEASDQLREHLTITTTRSQKLQQELEKAQQEILVDPLTLLFNRKAFDQKIETYMQAFAADGQVFSVIMVDIDAFKQFNDQHGHLVGDQVLKFLGSLLTKELKGKDFVARYGGEEFIILLENTYLANATIVANNIRHSLDGVKLKYVKTGEVLGNITVSAGVGTVCAGDTAMSLIKRVDTALYLAKQSGRNTVKTEQDLVLHREKSKVVDPTLVEFRK